jgi:hypothetical protein
VKWQLVLTGSHGAVGKDGSGTYGASGSGTHGASGSGLIKTPQDVSDDSPKRWKMAKEEDGSYRDGRYFFLTFVHYKKRCDRPVTHADHTFGKVERRTFGENGFPAKGQAPSSNSPNLT